MLRNALLSLIAVFALFAGLTVVAPKAQAGHRQYGRQAYYPPPIRQPRCYHVMFRECYREPWRCYGRFDCFVEANQVACGLRARGFQSYVR